jgi:hypothetical protein
MDELTQPRHQMARLQLVGQASLARAGGPGKPHGMQ